MPPLGASEGAASSMSTGPDIDDYGILSEQCRSAPLADDGTCDDAFPLQGRLPPLPTFDDLATPDDMAEESLQKASAGVYKLQGAMRDRWAAPAAIAGLAVALSAPAVWLSTIDRGMSTLAPSSVPQQWRRSKQA